MAKAKSSSSRRPFSPPPAKAGESPTTPQSPRSGTAISVKSAQPTQARQSLAMLFGDGAGLLALLLAPLVGGSPSGAVYGTDVFLNALRVLICIWGIASLALRPLPARDIRLVGIWSVFGLTLFSLLWHSRLLTYSTLLFAMLPATIDWLCFAIVFTIALQIFQSSDGYDAKIRQILPMVLIVGVTICAGNGLAQYVQANEPTARFGGTFFSQNFAAGAYALAIPIAAVAALSATNAARLTIWGVVSAVIVGGLAVTGSRVGAAAAFVGLGGAFLGAAIRLRGRLPWVRVGVLAGAWVLVLLVYGRPLLARVDSGGSRTTTATASANNGNEQSGLFRSYTWWGTLDMVVANPVLGTGPGTYPYRYARYAKVGKTDLAHQSFLQVAAEQGILAAALVIATLTIVFFGVGVRNKRMPPDADSPQDVLFQAALLGAIVAGVLRSTYDSEWSLLGTALPFWTIGGMLAGVALVPARKVQIGASVMPQNLRLTFAGVLVVPLFLSALLLRNASGRDTARELAQAGSPDARAAILAVANIWPPDPDALALAGDKKQAADIEPSGRRFFQLARQQEQTGDLQGARLNFDRATQAEPTNMQSWRALAELLEKVQDKVSALAAWRKIIELQDGPPGRIRAISEIPELHPAYAYAALADDAQRRRDVNATNFLRRESMQVVERYAETTPTYRTMEDAQAQLAGVDLAARRRDLRALYLRMATESKLETSERVEKTLAVLDALLKDGGVVQRPNLPPRDKFSAMRPQNWRQQIVAERGTARDNDPSRRNKT